MDRSQWKRVRFGDVVRCVDKSCRNPQAEGLTRVVGLEHLDPGELKITRWADVADGTSFTRTFRAGQVLFGKRRAYQRKAAVADFDGICSGDILVFEAYSQHLSSELLPYVVQCKPFFNHAVGTSAGSLSPRTKWSELSSWQFALPPTDVQARLVALLNSTESCRAAFSEALLRSHDLRKSVISCGIDNAPTCKFGDYIKALVPGKSISAKSIPASGEDCGVLKVSAVGRGKFLPEENKALFNQDQFREEFAVRSGDILISRCNTRELVGAVCVVREDHPNLMLCDKTIRIELDAESIDQRYAAEVLQIGSARAQIEMAATGTSDSMKNISQATIRSLKIPLPSLETQKQIGDSITELGIAEERLQEHVSALKFLCEELSGWLVI